MRECGSCHECCWQMAIKPLNKPAGVRCEHLLPVVETDAIQAQGGCCTIYDERPADCRSFTCSWFDNQLPENFRPDAIGIVFETCWVDTDTSRLHILIGFASEQEIRSVYHELHDWVVQNRYVAMVVPRPGESHDVEFLGTYPDICLWVEYLQALQTGGAQIRMGGETIDFSKILADQD